MSGSGYTMEEIRRSWAFHRAGDRIHRTDEYFAAFDAALAARDAVIREEAWDEGFNAGYDQVLVEAAIKTTVIDYRVNPYRAQSFTGTESDADE